MKYELQHGRNEKGLLEAAYKRGQRPPSFIEEAPELLPGLEIYFEAFGELSTCRPFIGMDGVPGPIPWDKMRDWGRQTGFEAEELEYFLRMLRALDDEYLIWAIKRRNKNDKPRAVQPPNSQHR